MEVLLIGSPIFDGPFVRRRMSWKEEVYSCTPTPGERKGKAIIEIQSDTRGRP